MIRVERAGDRAAVRRVNEEAFGPGSSEADLVDSLRVEQAYVPELCLVALDGEDVIVGHIFYSRATLGSGHEVLALAPMAVLPSHQGTGIGSELVRTSLERAAGTGYPFVVVLGHAGYYPRFGFEPASVHGIEAPWPVPPESWMAFPLPNHTPSARGMVRYPAAFDAVT